MRKYNMILASLGALLAAGQASAKVESSPEADTTPTQAKRADAWSSFFWGDYDADGQADAIVLQPGAALRLLHHTPQGGFEDATSTAGLEQLDDVRQALWADFDGDGLNDLFLSSPRGESALYRNVEGKSFVAVGEESGLQLRSSVFHAEWLDFDADQRPDLFLVTADRDVLYRNAGKGSFEEVRLELPQRAALPAGAFADIVPELDGAGRPGRGAPPGGPGVAGAPGPGPGSLQNGGSSSTGGTIDSTFVSSGKPRCATWVEDMSMPLNCLGASSVPTLGMLYPLGTELNIDGAGQVGIGTLTPGAQLDVLGDVRSSGQLISTAATGAPLVVASSELVGNLNADKLDGFDASAFSQFGSAVESAEIMDGSVSQVDLAPNSVGSAQIAPQAINASHIVNNSLTSAVIATDAIGASEIANNAVGSAEIAPDSILASDIATDAVTFNEIKPSSIDSSKVINNSLTADDLAGSSVGFSELQSNSVDSLKVIDNSLTANDLGTNSVGAAEIANGSIDYVEFDYPMERNSSGMVMWLQNDSTFSQADGILVETSGSSGVALEALATNTGGGVSYGVKGLSAGQFGYGVWGRANHPTGATFGVKGENYSSSGVGVKGQCYTTSGANIAVFGETPSSSGTAVRAEANSLSGTTYGVRVEQRSSSGRGILVENTATSGTTYGVLSYLDSPDGYALRGDADTTTGTADGVYGETNSSSSTARGIYGRYNATGGTGQGVRGYCASSSGYGVFSSGAFGGTGAKYFVQPHPEDSSKEIRFVCLEGNESGTYFRGSADLVSGYAEIQVPEDFRLVSEEEGLTIQLTAVGAPAQLWVEHQDLERIVVRGDIDAEFHYFVNGVRRGFAGLETIRENSSFVPEVRGVPYGTQYRAEHRQILVDNGILNPDFTPNEATAAARGWALKEVEYDEKGRVVNEFE